MEINIIKDYYKKEDRIAIPIGELECLNEFDETKKWLSECGLPMNKSRYLIDGKTLNKKNETFSDGKHFVLMKDEITNERITINLETSEIFSIHLEDGNEQRFFINSSIKQLIQFYYLIDIAKGDSLQEVILNFENQFKMIDPKSLEENNAWDIWIEEEKLHL